MTQSAPQIAIYHEHPDWFRPLFTELDRRGLGYLRIDARHHQYDLTSSREYALCFNRMSPSAYLRGNGSGIFYTLGYLSHLERLGTRVVNGYQTFTYETSKARQLILLESLRLPYPRTRIINHRSQTLAATTGFRFPVIVKANIGGSGAGIVRYDTVDALTWAIDHDQLQFGIDGTALVQEWIPARNSQIVRVETLGGKYLYAIKITASSDRFNLCPADICQTSNGVELVRTACAVDAPKNGMTVEAYTPPAEVIHAVEQIAEATRLDVGGIEYMVDDRDGRLYYYDINALSNFVADATQVIGFDPHARLVDFLEMLLKEAR